MHLLVKPGPKVYRVKWVYDKSIDRGAYQETDITDDGLLHNLFFCECKLADGVRLWDILKLLENHLDFYDQLFGCHAKELVQEGLSVFPSDLDDEIAYLELYWFLESDLEYGITGTLFPSFHGIGYEPEKIPYGVELVPVYELAGLPLKLGGYSLYKTEGPLNERMIVESPKAQFTLQQILYGIIWELSYFGGPIEREKRSREFFDTFCEAINENGKDTG